MQTKYMSIFIAFFLIAVLAYSSLFIVNEGQQAIRLRLGEIVKDSPSQSVKVSKPGLHIKIPFFDRVKYFDVRLQTFDVQSSRILTEEQKYVLVDYYVKWRIADLALYYKRTGGFSIQARQLLQQKINNALRAAFGKRSINQVVSGQRDDIMQLLKHEADESAKSLGIDVIDVRIKRIDLPKEVSLSVFERMRTEREQVATKHRSNGKAAAEIVRANADAKVTVLLAEARAKAAEIRAEGQAKAARIYADAYQSDDAFYKFYRSLKAYKHAFRNKTDLFLLSTESSFFKTFRSLKAK